MDSNFWKNKKVLLTGHTGFKGSWLSLWLQKLQVDLIGFSKSIALILMKHPEPGVWCLTPSYSIIIL